MIACVSTYILQKMVTAELMGFGIGNSYAQKHNRMHTQFNMYVFFQAFVVLSRRMLETMSMKVCIIFLIELYI